MNLSNENTHRRCYRHREHLRKPFFRESVPIISAEQPEPMEGKPDLSPERRTYMDREFGKMKRLYSNLLERHEQMANVRRVIEA